MGLSARVQSSPPRGPSATRRSGGSSRSRQPASSRASLAARSLALDAHGKSLSAALLDLPIDDPTSA